MPARNHVLLVHGIGDYTQTPGWSSSWQTCLRENATLFEPYKSDPARFDKDVKFAEIWYDDVFEESFRKRWQGLAQQLAGVPVPDVVRKLFTELEQGEEAKLPVFVWTHVLDALLWLGVAQARNEVIVQIGRRVRSALEAAKADGAAAHMLCHSLGTSVMHDAVLCLAASKDPVVANLFDPQRGGVRWKSWVTVANVSGAVVARQSPSDQLGLDKFRPATSRVRPPDLVERFINVRHKLDPFTWPAKYEMSDPDPAYRLVEPNRFGDPKAIHDLPTQFDDPIVARTCLRLFTGLNDLVDDGEFLLAKARYEVKYPRSDDVFATLRQQAHSGVDADAMIRYLVECAKKVMP